MTTNYSEIAAFGQLQRVTGNIISTDETTIYMYTDISPNNVIWTAV